MGKDNILISFCFKAANIFVNNINKNILSLRSLTGKGKGKFHPRTGHESAEGEKYNPTLSLDSALDGCG
jgi:hypothetical protein